MRIALVLIATVVAVAIGVSPAGAYWSATGTGWASAMTGTVAAPQDVVVPETSTGGVPIAWTVGAGGVEPAGFVVTREHDGGTSGACGSGPDTLITGPGCTDTDVPDGTHHYVVTAVYRSWTAPSSPSAPVTAARATALVFTAQPTDTIAGQPITPAVTVALRDALGSPVLAAGVSVSIAIAADPTGGTLSGEVTALTDADGVATFDELLVDEPGVGYTLAATSAGLASATSDAFRVLGPPVLGAAESYSVLAATAVVSTGTSTVSGDLGVSPGTSVTGFGPGIVGGDIHAGDASAAAAHAAVADAYADLSTRPVDHELVGNLGGLVLTPGVYHQTAAMSLTGVLTLDAEGDASATFVLQTDAAFNTAAASRVVLVGGAQPSNVFWVVAGAAGTGANSFISGTVVASGAITLGASTEVIGRALSLDAVTMADATIRFTEALPPTVMIDGGAAAVTKDTTPTISGTSSAAASSPVTVTVDGQTHVTVVDAAGAWSVTATELAAGAHAVVAKVRDGDGNGNAAFQNLTVEVNPAPVALGTAATYSVLAVTGVVSTGTTVVSGDLGVSPATSVTGFPPGIVGGSIHAGDPAAAAAQNDLLAALEDAGSRTPHTAIAGNLGGQTFHAGVHHTAAALALTGIVTLDAEGDPDAVFIFQTDAAFNTAAASSVVLARGAQASNVFWVVTGAAGTGANSSLAGTVLAAGAITLGADSALDGRALSRGTVTLASGTLTGTSPVDGGQDAALPDESVATP